MRTRYDRRVDRHEAKRLALQDPSAAAGIAEALAHAAPPVTLEALREIVGLGEALALCGRREDAPLLVWAADFIGDHDAPRGAGRGHTELAQGSLVFLQALAKLLDPAQAEGTMAACGDGRWRYVWDAWGELDLVGGAGEGGFRGVARVYGNPELALPP
jgi:hypothetical protein